jgi:hypothetical protein
MPTYFFGLGASQLIELLGGRSNPFVSHYLLEDSAHSVSAWAPTCPTVSAWRRASAFGYYLCKGCNACSARLVIARIFHAKKRGSPSPSPSQQPLHLHLDDHRQWRRPSPTRYGLPLDSLPPRRPICVLSSWLRVPSLSLSLPSAPSSTIRRPPAVAAPFTRYGLPFDSLPPRRPLRRLE